MTLIHVNLQQIHQTFVSYVDLANQQHVDVLDDMYQEKVERLDQHMRVLTQLATEGMEEHISPLLNTLLQEWAIKEAVELLLRYPDCFIDSSDLHLQQSFWEKLGRQHQALSSELLLQMQRGKEQRARAEQERAQSWQSVAYKSLEDQRQQNQQWFQQQREQFGQYQQANQQWATVAMVGVQQAQLGVKQWYDFAASIQQNKANMRKGPTKLAIIGFILIGIVALFGCAFFSMMHLY